MVRAAALVKVPRFKKAVELPNKPLDPLMVRLALLTMVSVAPSCTSTELATAAVPAPIRGVLLAVGMTTSVVAVGTPAGFQLAAVFQSVLVVPVQVVWASVGKASRLTSSSSSGVFIQEGIVWG